MIDEDLFDTSLAKALNVENEFDEAMDNGNYEKARQMIDNMAELNPMRAKDLETELLDLSLDTFTTN